MRYTGVVRKQVARGTEHLIPLARKLLGFVEHRINNSLLTQLVQRHVLPTGEIIRVGNINGLRFIEITGGMVKREVDEGPIFVVIFTTNNNPVYGWPIDFDVLFLYPASNRMVKKFEANQADYNFLKTPATWNIVNIGINWFEDTIDIIPVMNLGVQFQFNQGRFREEEINDELVWTLQSEDMPMVIQKAATSPTQTPTSGELRRWTEKSFVVSVDDPFTEYDETTPKEIVYTSLLWDQLPGDPQEWYLHMRDNEQEEWYLHRYLGDKTDPYSWPDPTSHDPPSISKREVLLYTYVQTGNLRTHQIRRYEMRTHDDEGDVIPEPRPITLEKEWTGYTIKSAANPAGVSENFEAFLHDVESENVGYCTYHLRNTAAGQDEAKLSFYTAPSEDILDANGNVVYAGGIANATLVFEIDFGQLFGPAIYPDTIGIDDHGIWWRLHGGFRYNEDTEEWEDQSTYIIFVQSIRAFGQYPEVIFRRNSNGTFSTVYQTNYDGFVAEGIKDPAISQNWMVFRWEENSYVVGDPARREYRYIKLTSTWDEDTQSNSTMRRIFDARTKPLPEEDEFDPDVRYGGSLNNGNYSVVYGYLEKLNG